MDAHMERIGRYELRNLLGRGGFATVYRAWDPLLRREVALKVLPSDWAEEPAMRHRFMREAQTLAGIEHPHIITVYDVGEADGRPYFTMPVMEGGTLTARLGYGVPLMETVAIISALAGALDTLHARRIVHRDVKAANVMFSAGGRVTLMDLGIARELDGAGLTSHSQIMLSPETAAPEQIRAQPAGPAADIYALGVLAYQLLAGRPPFTGDTAAVLHAHVYDPPPPLWELRPGLPGAVYAAVSEALAKDPARRPPTAGAFAAALRLAGEEAPVNAAPTMPLPRPVPPPDRRWLLTMGAGGGLAALALATGSWWLWGRDSAHGTQGSSTTATPSPPVPSDSPSPTAAPVPSPSPSATPATPVPRAPSAGTNAAVTLLRVPVGAANPIDVRMNPARAPFTDERVRRAFAQTVDPGTAQDFAARFALTSPLLIPATAQALGPVSPVAYDPVAARALLTAAGHPNGIAATITLTCGSGTNTQRLAILLQGQWERALSAKVLVRAVDVAAMRAAEQSEGYDLLLYSVASG